MKLANVIILLSLISGGAAISEEMSMTSTYEGVFLDDENVMPDYTFLNSNVIESSRGTPVFQKGFSMEVLGDDFLSPGYTQQTLNKLKVMGVTCLQINVNRYQDETNSLRIKATELTPSDRNLRNLISQAHDMGFKVMLKPQISLVDKFNQSFWREDIGFYNDNDWARWFREYKRFILHYAKLAARENVDLFSVGNELSFSTARTNEWIGIINQIKKVYSGKLTYSASWDNYKEIKFWNKLDYVGINAFFPLSNEYDADVNELKMGWLTWKRDIERWNNKHNKPVIFTQVGYASANSAAVEPWRVGSGQADVETQARCYEAFFETVWGSPWLAGIYWWKCTPYSNYSGANNKHFSPINKPAAQIVANYYNNHKITFNSVRASLNSMKVKREIQRLDGRDINLERGKPGSTIYDIEF